MKTAALLILSMLCSMPSALCRSIDVALVQSEIAWGDVDANLRMFESKIEEIKGSDMIILPELFTSGCDMRKVDPQIKIDDKHKIAAQYDRVIERMQQWALRSRAVVVGSTIYEESGRFYNRLLAVYPSGKYIHYDKYNCFKRGSFTAGEEHVVIDVKGVRCATYICYDLRFSEFSANDGRYDCAIYIANWSEATAEAWSALLRERAVENSACVMGVNCVGDDLSGVHFMGDSSIFSPTGELIDRCATDQQEVLRVRLKTKTKQK